MSVLIGRGKAPYQEGMKSFTIHAEVTHDLIYQGCKGRSTNCPIALAILEEMPIGTGAWVGPGQALVAVPNKEPYLGRTQFTCRMPTAATQFILDFDSGKEVKPITLVLEFSKYTETEGESA